MKLGIIGPSETEIMGFVETLSDVTKSVVAKIPVYEGKFGDLPVAVAICGICKVNAALSAQLLICRFGAEKIILCGVSGGIDPELGIGDTVLMSEVAYHDVDPRMLTHNPPYMEGHWFPADKELLSCAQEGAKRANVPHVVTVGRMVTGEAFIAENGRAEIIEKFDPLCTDMETGAAAHICYMNDIPFFAIRSVTDTAKKSGYATFEENVAESSKTAIAILLETVRLLAE